MPGKQGWRLLLVSCMLSTRGQQKKVERPKSHLEYSLDTNDGSPNLPEGLPYSIWQLVEHIRITQWDIPEFSRKPDHVSPEWPDGYWSKGKSPGNVKEWQRSIGEIEADRKSFISLLHKAGEEIYSHGCWMTGGGLPGVSKTVSGVSIGTTTGPDGFSPFLCSLTGKRIHCRFQAADGKYDCSE